MQKTGNGIDSVENFYFRWAFPLEMPPSSWIQSYFKVIFVM